MLIFMVKDKCGAAIIFARLLSEVTNKVPLSLVNGTVVISLTMNTQSGRKHFGAWKITPQERLTVDVAFI